MNSMHFSFSKCFSASLVCWVKLQIPVSWVHPILVGPVNLASIDTAVPIFHDQTHVQEPSLVRVGLHTDHFTKPRGSNTHLDLLANLYSVILR